MNIFTWHVHASYLFYLSQLPHRIYVPAREGRPEGYGGRTPGFPWPDNLIEVPAREAGRLPIDVVIFQSRKNYLEDQYEILSDWQRRLPQIYLEHEPPCEHPVDTKHVVDDPNILLIHVTHFNDLMWDSGRTPHAVVEHGVIVPQDVTYTGELQRGIVVVNGLSTHGRSLGFDVYKRAEAVLPLDLVGMGSYSIGGLGEVPHDVLPQFLSRYRFFFNPVRYTRLGLSVCEAMMLGLPVVGLGTTEMADVIQNGINGFAGTNVDSLMNVMKELITDRNLAREWSEGAKKTAMERFNINRFIDDWGETLSLITGIAPARGIRSKSPADEERGEKERRIGDAR